jgi:AcrR family transcriptional regulator
VPAFRSCLPRDGTVSRVAGKRLTRAESRERTKERLLDAAAGLFAERGVNGTSVEQITDRAGYTRGAFYGNFEDKHELIEGLVRDAGAVLTRPTDPRTPPSASPSG